MFNHHSQEQEEQIRNSLLAGAYNLLIGAGVSLDSTDRNGNNLPSGHAFKAELCSLKGVGDTTSLQRVFSTLTPDETKRHVTDRFSECHPGPTAQTLRSFLWRRIFTLNVDDAMQAAYSNRAALQELQTINFTDDFIERDTLDSLQIIHLHGWAGRPDDGYVFALSQYAPSILVTPQPDNLSEADCAKYDLLLFKGTVIDFVNYFLKKTGPAKAPTRVMDVDDTFILPEGVSNRERLAFFSDFETIPGHASDGSGIPRFLYGAQASWSDISQGIDIGRRVSASLQVDIDTILRRNPPEKALLLFVDEAGTGKSTIIKRLGVETARKNIKALWCYTSARLEVARTASTIDLIDDDLVIFFDNLADNVGQVAEIFEVCEKPNITFVGCERSYRLPYLREALRKVDYSSRQGRSLDENEASALIALFGRYGLIGTEAAIKRRASFAASIARDPISIACCRILNDFSPFDAILRSIWRDTKGEERARYVVAALAARCFRSGIRYETLRTVSGARSWLEQFETTHPLPLTLSVEFGREFVKPLNENVGEQMLKYCSQEDPDLLLHLFVELGNAIASRVNRMAIRRRSPEARLAGSLFDFDRIVRPYLGDRSFDFYTQTTERWQWNSRYWEQVALMYLDEFYAAPSSAPGIEAYGRALQHARHSTSIEWHPHPLTTLGKVLLAYTDARDVVDNDKFDEAHRSLWDAIKMEQRARLNIQPFIILLSGTRRHLQRGGVLNDFQFRRTQVIMELSERKYRHEPVVQEEIETLRNMLFRT